MRQKLFDIAETLGWRICVEECDGSIDLKNRSPAGEDLIFNIEGSDIALEVKALALYFDPDEHAAMWVGSRGRNGVPSSILTIIKDAYAIKNMLNELAKALEKEMNKNDQILS